ncbi:unnamed protein product [Darwinula stevensoni]|uniref:START domain-containing protein n=1 Tax=Darwinula stevensoni TaxID=69355 RepID=A0A7R9A160_9CRUS|nr:unnamed protein product [Darwinula stevensoni]CAG0882767.1 unnamed protein product [Darwinula stevensoni]
MSSVVDVPADVIFREDWNHVADYPKWNPNLIHTEVILDITPRCRLSYQVSAPLGNGLIWSRDAVIVTYWGNEGNATHIAFASSTWPAFPPSDRYVRATVYPQGFTHTPLPGDPERTFVQWVYHVDVHLALVPARVLDLILPKACRDNFVHFIEHAKGLRRASEKV